MSVLTLIDFSGYLALLAVALVFASLRRSLGWGLVASGSAFAASTFVLNVIKPPTLYLVVLIVPVIEEAARQMVAHRSVKEGDVSFVSALLFSIGISYGDWSRNLIGAGLRLLDSDWARAGDRLESAFHVLSLHFLLSLIILAPPLFGRRILNFVAALAVHVSHNAGLAYVLETKHMAVVRLWDHSTIVLVVAALLVFAGSQRIGPIIRP